MATYTQAVYAGWGLAQLPICHPVNGQCGCGRGHTGKAVGKAALIRGGFRAASSDLEVLEGWATTFPNSNWGAALAPSGLAVIDTDSEEAEVEVNTLGVPVTLTVSTGSGGKHRYYRKPFALPIGNAIHTGKSGKIDLLSDGYTILPPSLHASGKRYAWEIDLPQVEGSIPELPEWACIRLVQGVLGLPNLSIRGARLYLGLEWVNSSGDPEPDRSETLYAIACEAVRAGASDQKVQGLLADRDEILGATWNAGPKYLGRRDAELRYAEACQRARATVANEPRLVLGRGTREETPANLLLQGLEKTDLGNAAAMAILYKDKLAYNPGHQRWYRWLGHSWTQATDGDVQLAAMDAAKARLSLSVGNADDKGVAWALRSQDAYRIESAVKLARVTLRREGEWDQQDNLFAAANGVIDLETGEIRPGDPGDLITLQSSYSYDTRQGCPRFDRFLLDVFNGDSAMVEWIWRAIGYSLTGETREECLFLLHGTGSNGKGTLDWVLQQVLGTYYMSAPFSTFEENKNESATNDLAMLAGKRMVSASENSEGRRLNESRIKRATGRDPITARFLHREFFTYHPRFKIWLQANHLPIIRGTDEGIWRRMRMLPFTVSFRGRENHKLRDELEAELPGILARAVNSAGLWYTKGGLRIEEGPSKVREATRDYRAEMDTLAIFLEDCTDEGGMVEASSLYRAYRGWASDKGEYVMGHSSFGRKIVERGFDRSRTSTSRFYNGITLNDAGDRFSQKAM